ncbi:uncharacterized protein [Haliotis asinina]|uniref:uncharacterized protein n=1 Tax=Haliotis asinina TaxID=109174 RepID=UPI00353243C6
MRMIHNMAVFNRQYLADPPHFRMTSLEQIQAKLSPGAWLASLDLQDAYLHVPIHPRHRKYLRFVFNGIHYQWRVLPFGISTAPWLFTCITLLVTRFLHLRGVDFDPYIDDCLLNHGSPLLLRKQLDFSTRPLHQLGWMVNTNKSHLEPTQDLHRGIIFNEGQSCQGPSRSVAEDSGVSGSRSLSTHDPQRVAVSVGSFDIGAGSYSQRAPYATALTEVSVTIHPDERPQVTGSSTSTSTSLSPVVDGRIECLRRRLFGRLQSRPRVVRGFVPARVGRPSGPRTTSGLWSDAERLWHINNLELQAVILAVRHWLPILSNTKLLVASDNSTVVWVIQNQGTTRSKQLLDQRFMLADLC